MLEPDSELIELNNRESSLDSSSFKAVETSSISAKVSNKVKKAKENEI